MSFTQACQTQKLIHSNQLKLLMCSGASSFSHRDDSIIVRYVRLLSRLQVLWYRKSLRCKPCVANHANRCSTPRYLGSPEPRYLPRNQTDHVWWGSLPLTILIKGGGVGKKDLQPANLPFPIANTFQVGSLPHKLFWSRAKMSYDMCDS